jgi:hypothetical protein
MSLLTPSNTLCCAQAHPGDPPTLLASLLASPALLPLPLPLPLLLLMAASRWRAQDGIRAAEPPPPAAAPPLGAPGEGLLVLVDPGDIHKERERGGSSIHQRDAAAVSHVCVVLQAFLLAPGCW